MDIPYATKFEKTPTVNEQAVPQPAFLQAPPDIQHFQPLFAQQMDEVLDVNARVARDEWPSEFLEKYGLDVETPEPIRHHVDEFGRLSSKKAALLVRMDHPLDLCKDIRSWLADRDIHYRRANIPAESYDFIYGVLGLDLFVGHAILRAFNVVFGIKWIEKVVRPEEWFGCNITTYGEGCPGHPASPAGHGAVAGATAKRLIELLGSKMLDNEVRTVIMTCLHFASYRTFAGVHRQHENLRGFVIGWAVTGRVSYAQAIQEIKAYVPELNLAA